MSKTLTLIFNDGSKREVGIVRPPRRTFWKHGRIANVFRHKAAEVLAGNPQGESEEQAMMLLELMTDLERERFQAFADDVVRQSTRPQLTADELENLTEVSYWQVFASFFYSAPEEKIETKEGEVAASDLESFPGESELPSISQDVQDVQSAAV